MKILITSTGSWGTGSFTAIDAMLVEFLRLGHEVKVFFPEAPDMHQAPVNSDRPFWCYEIWQFPITRAGVTLSTYPLIIPDPHPRNPNPLTFKSLTQAQLDLYFDDCEHRLAKIITEFQPDIIESNHIWAMGYVLQRLGVPYICTAHNTDQMAFEYDSRMRPYATAAAQKAAFVFSTSTNIEANIQSYYGITKDKIVLIPNCYDRTIFKPLAVDRDKLLHTLGLDIPRDATIINLTGKISRTKGVDILLLANKLLQQRHNNVHILILGTGEIESVLDDDKLDDYCFTHVHFLGHRSPRCVAEIHNISKFSVIPSRTEVFPPITALEAMGCGLPIVISKLGPTTTKIVGRVFEQENVVQLSDAISEILNLNDQDYQQLRQQAISAMTDFTWEQNVAKRLEYYRRVIDLRRHAQAK